MTYIPRYTAKYHAGRAIQDVVSDRHGAVQSAAEAGVGEDAFFCTPLSVYPVTELPNLVSRVLVNSL